MEALMVFFCTARKESYLENQQDSFLQLFRILVIKYFYRNYDRFIHFFLNNLIKG